MAQLGFQEASRVKGRLLALTGTETNEFRHLLPYFEKAFLHRMELFTLEGKERKKRTFVDYDNASLPTIEDKLLFVLLFVKQNLTQEVMAFMFGMSPAKVHEWLQTLIPILKQALYLSNDLPVKSKKDLSESLKEKESPLFATTVPNAPSSDR